MATRPDSAHRRSTRYAVAGGALLAAAVVAIVVLALSAGGDGGERGSITGQAGGAVDAGHIHGLGIDPADGSLFIATHNGLFRAAERSTDAPRVGTSDRDLMGFSVVGPNHFLASGHPGSEADLPGNIGLTESRDGGRTWTPVSLLGEADFHVLRASGSHVYGFDGVDGRFMVSTDLGRDWQERDIPAPPFDVAIDPSDREHLAAATEDGVYESRDAGRTWSRRDDRLALLAWAARDRLFLLDASGRVLVSRDGGRSVEQRGAVGGQPVAFMATEDAVYVALADGTVMQSTDDGGTFAVRATL
jgi:photosystem II stability/assembly factor-like uncharacterized protein